VPAEHINRYNVHETQKQHINQRHGMSIIVLKYIYIYNNKACANILLYPMVCDGVGGNGQESFYLSLQSRPFNHTEIFSCIRI
jgi:hypothetical protein